MWRERIIEAKKAKGITIKMMAERTPSHLTVETITRILNEKTDDPRISTVLALGESVGLSPWELFAETNAIVAYESYTSLQAERDALAAENIALKNENKDFKDKEYFLKIENDHLHLTLEHKEQVLAHKEEIVKLQQSLLDMYKIGGSGSGVCKF